MDNLLIVFVKNLKLGKVKTRLAKDIGENAAFDVYRTLVNITQKETQKLNNCDLHIYFSDTIDSYLWSDKQAFIQEGETLGDRMMNAFEAGFSKGYMHIVGIGSDLPDIRVEILNQGFDALKKKDTVFGPSEDGGYYLLGMNTLIPEIFKNKSWSTETLLHETMDELNQNNYSVVLLEALNDIDTIEDLRNSSIASLCPTNH